MINTPREQRLLDALQKIQSMSRAAVYMSPSELWGNLANVHDLANDAIKTSGMTEKQILERQETIAALNRE